MKKTISITMIIAMIISAFAITGIANAATTKQMVKFAIGDTLKTKSIIQGNIGNIFAKDEKVTRYKNSNKTLNKKSKKINGKTYTFKIIQNKIANRSFNRKYSEPSDKLSEVYEFKDNLTDMNMNVATPTIKGYKLKTKKTNYTSRTQFRDNLKKTTVNAPVKGTVVNKNTDKIHNSINSPTISISSSKKKITVCYSLLFKVLKDKQEEKITKKSETKYEKSIFTTGSSQNETVKFTLTYTKK